MDSELCYIDIQVSKGLCKGPTAQHRQAYEPSVQVKTRVKPQERTWASESLRDGVFDAMTGLQNELPLQKFEWL